MARTYSSAMAIHTVRGRGRFYKGKPIFYGVASFIQHEGPAIEVTDPRPPAPQAQQSREPDNKGSAADNKPV